VFSVADWTSGSSNREPLLIRAVEDGDLAKVRKLTAKGANVNVTDNYGGTALQYAAASGNDKMTHLLLEAGADVNARQPGAVGYDALDQAA